ncbi:MAG: hypothetical protein J5589_01090 [Firmicutes bacterium]|nr:hypothetical protein [Bacillota bacterium]
MDKRIEKTKEKLRQALGELVRTESIDRISVSALCERAGINRTTFYKYYSVPADIQQEIIDENIADILQLMWQEENAWDIRDLILRTLQMVRRNRKLLEGGSHELTMRMTQQLVKNLRMPEVYQGSELYFIAGGTAAVIDQWIKHDFDTRAPEDVADEVALYIKAVIA